MSKTVIGLMDSLGEAQAAVRDLVASGIRADDIGFMADPKDTIPPSAYLNEAEGSRAASDEAGVRRGVVVTVAADGAQADLAAEVMKRHGAQAAG